MRAYRGGLLHTISQNVYHRGSMKAIQLGIILSLTSVAWAQQNHSHTREVHGVPGGVPDFCAQPTVTSVADGAWSDPATWSTGKVPSSEDRVGISAPREVLYDVASDAKLACVEVRGRLRFRVDANTRMKTVNLMVMDEGYLEVGSADHSIGLERYRGNHHCRSEDRSPTRSGGARRGNRKPRQDHDERQERSPPRLCAWRKEPLAGQTTLTTRRGA